MLSAPYKLKFEQGESPALYGAVTQHMPSRRGGTKRVVNAIPASRLLPWVRAVAAKNFLVPEWGPAAHAPTRGRVWPTCLSHVATPRSPSQSAPAQNGRESGPLDGRDYAVLQHRIKQGFRLAQTLVYTVLLTQHMPYIQTASQQ